ncbi:DUF485 domain-containing protein [Luteithermobacter gelatinilyticus]|uniref:DUF485 domain-containing protein n=1 Tax=Luteithermobacter gelatinilyticus TaxID=2582913 RepID=UPI00143CF77B|nr:DUF485 domain-containing protein [Luteithermobacter gelatinilyticus]
MPEDTVAKDMSVAYINHPKFRKMLARRTAVTLGLTAFILLVYGFYIFATAYLPELIAQPVSNGATLTWGIILVLAVIVNGMLCAGVYTWWANRRFDVLKDEFLKEVKK